MCLSPIRIVNPAKRLSSFGGQRAVIYVPCGQCADCKTQKHLEWYSRAYYQAKGTLDEGGFIYFDTFTYSNKYLPWTKDVLGIDDEDLNFPCFNRDHFTKFLHSLRTHYSRLLGKDSKHRIEYMMASEYGLNPSDGKTFRPHYHIMFYVFGDIDPIDFSHQVAKYWYYGRTDGGHYKTHDYILNHVFGKGYNTNPKDVLAVSCYVSKYIMKDSDFEETIQLRMAKLRAFEDIRCSYFKFAKMKSDYRKIKNCIDQFHRQSHHFGEYFLRDPEVDWDKVYKTCRVTIPDSKTIEKEIPLAGYYTSKMFYYKDENKKMKLRPEAINWRKERMVKVVLPAQVEQFKLMFEKMCNQEQQETILKMLDGRTPEYYCLYQLCYRGYTRMNLQYNPSTIVHPGSVQQLSSAESNVEMWLDFIYRHTTDSEPQIYHYSTVPDKKRFGGEAFYTNRYLGDNDKGYVHECPNMQDNYGFDDYLDKFMGSFSYKVRNRHKANRGFSVYYGDCVNQETWIKRHVINQNSDYRFRQFDDLASYISQTVLGPRGEAKEKAFREELAQKKRMKVASGRFS